MLRMRSCACLLPWGGTLGWAHQVLGCEHGMRGGLRETPEELMAWRAQAGRAGPRSSQPAGSALMHSFRALPSSHRPCTASAHSGSPGRVLLRDWSSPDQSRWNKQQVKTQWGRKGAAWMLDHSSKAGDPGDNYSQGDTGEVALLCHFSKPKMPGTQPACMCSSAAARFPFPEMACNSVFKENGSHPKNTHI